MRPLPLSAINSPPRLTTVKGNSILHRIRRFERINPLQLRQSRVHGQLQAHAIHGGFHHHRRDGLNEPLVLVNHPLIHENRLSY